ncbi:MAG: response regulator [Pseudomonadota bacterium]|jgi:CheY-like chemotaxis protein|nr:response regulator [Xanthomonadaceae bacterium]MDE2248846.1 response regulator [Xanthomonadaceae bacterium]MDE3209536.1 response regulator [Pseudomonadota bacterium]
MMQGHGAINILMAEDDADDRVLFADAFRDSGVEVALDFVGDGVELLQRLQGLLDDRASALPELLLLDLNMPRMDGREALRAIREHAGLKHLPVIMMTTSSSRLDIMVSYQLGANSYVTKPRRYDELIAVLQSLEHYWMETVQLPVAGPAGGA